MYALPPALKRGFADHLRDLRFSLVERTARWRTDPEGQLIGDRIGQYRDPNWSGRPLPPSIALIREPEPRGPAPDSLRVRPEFTEHSGLFVARISLDGTTDAYGTGEVAGPLLRNATRRGRSTTCWNTDSYGYDDRTPSLYQSHPWVLCVRRDGSAFGVLADTTWRCQVLTRRDAIVFRGVGAPFRVLVIERSSPQDVVRALSDLTGRMPMPPRWSLGYQQCRWSYAPDARVREIAGEFRSRRLPCDVIWLDIDYMDGFRCFTFDTEGFPDPDDLNRRLHDQGFRTVWMIDPGLKVDERYRTYAEGREQEHFVQSASGREYHGKVWPGPCAFPDFTRAGTRRWWAGLYGPFLARGIDGVWNDMNEPAVFGVPTKTMPEDNIHRADPELGGHGPHARYHNVYGMLMARATREGIAEARPDKRPFVLTRAGYLGSQRYAATWTGDNVSNWPHLGWSISMALNLGLSGQPFCGPDIGGFSGEATAALFARWMGIGALLPFSRGHSDKPSGPHEPWAFGAEAERVCRLALERRYRLLPYLYTLFREAHETGLPVARPLFFADPTDPSLRRADDAFLLGADVMVRACVGERQTACHAPFPKGAWREFEPLACGSGSRGGGVSSLAHPWLPRLYLREGAILPLGPVMQFSDEHRVDPLTLVLNADGAGCAHGTLYEDAGDGFGFERGEFTLTTFEARLQGGRVDLRERHTGSMPKRARRVETVEL